MFFYDSFYCLCNLLQVSLDLHRLVMWSICDALYTAVLGDLNLSTEHHQAENIVDLSTNMFLKFITFIEDQHFSPNIVSSHLFSTLMPMLTEDIQFNLEGSLAVFEEKNGALPVHRYVLSNYCAGGIIQLSKSWFLHPETMSKEDLFAQYHTMISLFFATISPELSLPL